MNREELKEMIRNADFTKEKRLLALELFAEDAKLNCELIEDFVSYCNVLIRTNGYVPDKKVHECTYRYISSIENRHWGLSSHLVYLYNREAEYFTFLGSSNESLFYAEKILDSENADHVYYVSAIIYILNTLANAKLYGMMLPLVERIQMLCEDPEISQQYRTIMELSLLDIYTLNRDYDNYMVQLEKARKLESLMKDGDVLREPARIHMLASSYFFKKTCDTKTGEEMAADLEEIIALMERMHGVLDCLEPLLVVVFDAAREKMPMAELIDDILKIIEIDSIKSDRIAFYEYLLDRCAIAQEDYPAAYASYLGLLREYGKIRADAEEQSIEITLWQHATQLKYMDAANIDMLTGAYSRYAYQISLDNLKSKEHSAIIVADLNRLKYINDTYGHGTGDTALIIVADRLRECFGPLGKIYRVGGDEFFIIADADEEEIREAIMKMEKMNEEAFIGDACLNVSIGYAMFSDDVPYDEALKKADQSMYVRKREFYSKSGLDRRK